MSVSADVAIRSLQIVGEQTSRTLRIDTVRLRANLVRPRLMQAVGSGTAAQWLIARRQRRYVSRLSTPR